MNTPMLYRIFETSLGWAAVVGFEEKISRLELPGPSRCKLETSLWEGIRDQLVETELGFADSVEKLKAYFAGERVDFDCEVDAGYGAFDRQVWATAREIPYGEVRTYGWIAERIGRPQAARAVGQALGRNPIPVIVPCHRVLRSDGGLGGFSCGLEWKRKMLALERASARCSTIRSIGLSIVR